MGGYRSDIKKDVAQVLLDKSLQNSEFFEIDEEVEDEEVEWLEGIFDVDMGDTLELETTKDFIEQYTGNRSAVLDWVNVFKANKKKELGAIQFSKTKKETYIPDNYILDVELDLESLNSDYGLELLNNLEDSDDIFEDMFWSNSTFATTGEVDEELDESIDPEFSDDDEDSYFDYVDDTLSWLDDIDETYISEVENLDLLSERDKMLKSSFNILEGDDYKIMGAYADYDRESRDIRERLDSLQTNKRLKGIHHLSYIGNPLGDSTTASKKVKKLLGVNGLASQKKEKKTINLETHKQGRTQPSLNSVVPKIKLKEVSDKN